MKISASVYSSPERSLPELVKDLDQHGIDYFHIDCRDDQSVFADIRTIRAHSNTPIDLHLITDDPEQYFSDINALNIELVTLQHESLGDYVYRGGLASKVGLGIVSNTAVDVFKPLVDQYDFVLMMATIPGQSGGSFDKINFRKIRQFKNAFPGKQIHVDGGVNGEVSFILRNMGVHAAVVGSYLFKNQPLGAALLDLRTHTVESHYVVGDFMRHREETPIIGPKERGLKDVLECIEGYRLGFTILEDEHHQLEGIISNADLRRELLRNVAHPEKIDVAAMINREPITIQSKTTVRDMLMYLKQFDFPINYLPVVDEEKQVKGVVSFLNLVKGEL
jgi:pentose-5-phosphate-3-epimerase